MSQDVTQWLEEIKQLRTQVVTLQRERDEAFSEAATWRERLDAEMKLRVRETTLLRQQLETLEAAQRRLEGSSKAPSTEADAATPETLESPAETSQSERAQQFQDILASFQTVDELRQYVGELAQERDRLQQSLEEERKAHTDTRENLSIALGDTIDLLAHRSDSQAANPDGAEP